MPGTYSYVYTSNAQPALIRKNEEKVGRLMHSEHGQPYASRRDAIIIVPHILPQESGKLIRSTSNRPIFSFFANVRA